MTATAMRLSGNDLRRVLDTVLALNGCRSLAAFSLDGLAALNRLFPAEAVCIQWIPVGDKPVLTLVNAGFPYTRAEIEFYRSHVAEHPVLRHYRRHGYGRAVRMSDVCPAAEWRDHPIRRTCLAPHGLEHGLYLMLSDAPGHATAVSFDRRAPAFTRRDAAVLDALGPHLAQVLARLGGRSGGTRPWREPRTHDYLAGELRVSNREAEALIRLAEGGSNAEIAAALQVATATLKKHLQNAYAKLGVRSRHAAARRVLEALGRLR
jgi:DNA-binding CsgD family transcriptional regulator